MMGQAARVARFSRQLVLPEVGQVGMERLARTRALVVGCGGLGAPVIQYLGSAGLGYLALADDDVVEISNLNRQVLFRAEDLGRPKVVCAAEWVTRLDDAIEVEAIHERISVHNARDLVKRFDIVLDCTDGLGNKFLLNDACVLERRPLVHGAVTAFSGQIVDVLEGGACLRCIFPEMPEAGAIQSCQEAGILGAACGWVGAMMALEAIKLVTDIPSGLARKYVEINLLSGGVVARSVPRDPQCIACGGSPSVTGRNEADYESEHCEI
jgi:molybdopterin/thiamine biosynthesis adenylyltransferase